MRESSIKTCFHIIGAALCIPAVFLLLPCIFSSPQESGATIVILLAISFGLGTIAIYMFAGAPHLTRFLKRQFPSEGHRTHRIRPPRHGLKACLGFVLGTIPLAASLISLLLLPSNERPEWIGDILMVGIVLSPLLLTWSAAHIAWLRGVSPNAPVTVSLVGLVTLILHPLAGIILMTAGPIVTALSLRSNKGLLPGWRKVRRE